MSSRTIPKDSLLHRLFACGQTGYWCDEAKSFFHGHLKDFANHRKVILSGDGRPQEILLSLLRDLKADDVYPADCANCTHLELWDFILSSSRLSKEILFGSAKDREELYRIIDKAHFTGLVNGVSLKLYGGVAGYLSAPENHITLKTVQFRISLLPQTLNNFDYLKSKFSLFTIKNWDKVREILLYENVEQMQESYAIWGKYASNNRDWSDSPEVKATIARYLSRKNRINSISDAVAAPLPDAVNGFQLHTATINKPQSEPPLQAEPDRNTQGISQLMNTIKSPDNILLSTKAREMLAKTTSVKITGSLTADNIGKIIKLFAPMVGIGFIMGACQHFYPKSLIIPTILSFLTVIYSFFFMTEIMRIYKHLENSTDTFGEFTEFAQAEGYGNTLCQILTDESLSTRLETFLNDWKKERWQEMFPKVFSGLDDTRAYARMVDVIDKKSKSLEMLNILKNDTGETESDWAVALATLNEIRDEKEMLNFHQNLEKAYLERLDGHGVSLKSLSA